MRHDLIGLLIVLAASFGGPLGAAEKPAAAPDAARQASGKFESRAWTIEPVGAYAFRVKESGFDDEPGIKLAVSNREFDAELLNRWVDRETWIDQRFKVAGEVFVAFFELSPTGEYKGLSYYFESGDGCGFCYDGKTKSTLKLTAGRLKGRLTLVGKEGELAFDVEVDVPLAPEGHGKPLPADGGDVGAVYAKYHQAITEFKHEGVIAALTKANAEYFKKDPDNVFGAWQRDHPTESYKVVQGFVNGDYALLLIDGKTSYSGVLVEVLFVKEDGAWKIRDELMQVKLGS